MKITKVDIFQVHIPLKEPFIISYSSFHTMPAIIIKMHTDMGIVGYGESVPDEHVTGESIHSVFAALKYQFIPTLVGKDPRNIKQIHALLDQMLAYNGAAKACIDIACYDILGKSSNLPVYALLGGRKEEQPTIPRVLSILEPEVLAKQAIEAVEMGYRELKMKLGDNPETDIKRVKAVREAVGEDIPIRVDVNQGWETPQTAIKAIHLLKPYHVSWVEQPISKLDISLFKTVKDMSPIPLMADESMVTQQNLRTLIKDQSVDYINIKLMKSGGIYPAHQLATQAALFGLNCQIGSMVESSIASAAGFHVAVSKQNIISTEISGPLKFTTDVGDLTYDIPYVNLTSKSGLGITVNDERIEALTETKETIGG